MRTSSTPSPFYVSPNFLSVMGIEVLFGQGFDPNLPHGVLLSETAAHFFGSENLIGRTLTSPQEDGEPMTVIGIVKDFHFVDMRHTIGPAFLTTRKLGSDRFMHTLFRLDRTDLPAAVEEVKALWKRVLPEYELHRVLFLDEAFAAKYETEQRVGLVMGWMSAVAIAISCMGLLGLVALAVVRPHQGNWHPQGIGGYDRQRVAVAVARIRLAGGGGQCDCLACGLSRVEPMARVLRLSR